MNKKVFEHVYKHPLIDDKELILIMNVHEKVNVKKGAFIIKEGQTANEYLIVESGLMRSFVYSCKGDDITTNFFTVNEIVIEVSALFERIPTKESIQALTDCICYQINFDVFKELFHSLDGFREWGKVWLSGNLFHFKQRSVSMIAYSASERYLMLSKEKPQTIQYAPLKTIASYLGITDTSLSRIRKSLVKAGEQKLS
ncbi:MAG: hypothetical protein RL662_968 [Bacteroidota bacterium]|jgi:CRP-like cAMP-binding protein